VTSVSEAQYLSPKGDEITLRVYRASEIFGEGSFSRTLHRYWAPALEGSEVVEWPADGPFVNDGAEPVVQTANPLGRRLV
jgi:hypothetical protein